jgi:hypothetical protein
MKTRTPTRWFSFRIYPFALIICLFVLGTGCNIFRARPEPPDAKAPPIPTGPLEKPSAQQLVTYLNREASKLQSIQTTDLTIDVRSQGNSITMDGTLLCQKPRYFKLTGRKLGSQQVLVGSNDERFWFYIPRAEDALYYCSHTEYANGTSAELPFPFQPEWVLEALGMGRIDPDGPLRVDEDRATYRLIEESKLRGQGIKKVTVFYKGRAHGEQPQVKARMMYDDRDRLICQATVKSVTRIGTVTVPQMIKLEWPAQDTELVLDLGRAQVNRQLTMDAFQMPRLGSRQVDLARDRPTGRGVVPVQFR